MRDRGRCEVLKKESGCSCRLELPTALHGIENHNGTGPQNFSRSKDIRPLMLAVAATASLSTQKNAPATPESALYRYVSCPDPHFHYDLVRTLAAPGYTAYVLDMTSQQYLTEAAVNHPVP
jgi:hypothetical protein